MPEILFAAEIALSGLYRSAPEPELNLFSSSRTVMAQLRTGPAQCIHRLARVLRVGSRRYSRSRRLLGFEKGWKGKCLPMPLRSCAPRAAKRA